LADFAIRLIWTYGLLSEPDSLWIVVAATRSSAASMAP
jgi:hypothetical protein